MDGSAWIASAFAEAGTVTVVFNGAVVTNEQLIRGPSWYLERPGFWHGADTGPSRRPSRRYLEVRIWIRRAVKSTKCITISTWLAPAP